MQELIKRLEKEKWHVSGVDIQEAINLIESQAAEIGVLKIAHEAHQTSNLRMLVVLKKQAVEIAELREERAKAVAHFPTLVAEARDKSGSCIICGFHPEMAAMWCDDYLKLKSLLENKHE